MSRRQAKSSKGRRAGIYVRVSQDRSGDETTTQRQEADCRDLCRLKGWDVAFVFRDVDTSAFDTRVQRPEYQRMLEAVEAGTIDAIVVWKLDRLARRVRDVLDVSALLQEKGADLVSVNDAGIDTAGPMGRFTLTVMGAVAELESEMISLRVKRAKQAEAKGGRDPGGGNLPFGWKFETVERVRGTRTETVRISSPEVEPSQAEALREAARRLLDDGESLNRLAMEMRDRGFRTPPTKKCPEGKLINFVSLRNMLTNPRLAGYRTHRPKGGDTRLVDLYPTTAWEPILDNDTFRRLQERFGNEVVQTEDGLRLILRGSGGEHVMRERHLLTGLIWCGKCGDERMRRMDNAKNGDRYVCRGNCSTTIKRDLVERYVVKESLTMLMGRRMLGDDRPEVDTEALTIEAADLRERLRELSLARFVDRRIGDDEFEVARVALQEQLITVEGRLAHAREMTVGPIPGTPFAGFDTWWENATLAERRRTLEGAVSRIVVAPLSHEIVQPYRRSGVVVDESTPVLTGVPMERRDEVSRARVTIEWRPEVVPEPKLGSGSHPDDAFPPKRRAPSKRELATTAAKIAGG